MKAKSIKGKSTEEISSALRESMADGYKPTLAIVFISVKQNREAISKLLDEKGIQIFNATTAGEFIDGEIEGGSIVMMLLDMNPAYFKMEFLETSQETAFEDGNKLGITGKEILLMLTKIKLPKHHFICIKACLLQRQLAALLI